MPKFTSIEIGPAQTAGSDRYFPTAYEAGVCVDLRTTCFVLWRLASAFHISLLVSQGSAHGDVANWNGDSFNSLQLILALKLVQFSSLGGAGTWFLLREEEEVG